MKDLTTAEKMSMAAEAGVKLPHYTNTDSSIDFPDQVKAGADIHSGDGGYSEGTQEKYEEFVKNRNKRTAK
jgi:hypothetical protein